ncbi:MAG: hypothetical protein KTR15_07145 [Phycisphaeraceae bacterium]|nr:hypothetical protein [Phycisphaeraceae bacterium]
MSTLRKQEPAGPGLKRIACAQVESAIRCLTRQADQGVAAAEAIDQARAVLALVEPDLPRPVARRDQAILTRLSDGLARLTEPVLLAGQLGQRYKKNPPDSALASAVKTLRKRWAAGGQSGSAMSSKAGSFNPAIYRLVADMAELRGHLGGWPVDAIASDQPPRGLRRTYAKARKLANEPITAATLPALARALIELATQLGVVSKCCPSMVKAQRKLITRATDELNTLIINDKLDTALRAELGKGASKALPSKKPMAQRAAACLGPDLDTALAETPAAMMKRMQAYWTAWRSASA